METLRLPAPAPAPLLEVPFERYAVEKPEPPGEFRLRDYWRVVHAQRRTIAVCGSLALGAALLFNYVAVPVYRSTATLQIDREQPNTARLEDSLVQPLEQPDYIETQYKILKSRTLARGVMEKLGLAERPEYRRRGLRAALDPPRLGGELNPAVVSRFLDAVTVTPGKGTRLVEVAIDSVSPEVAARTANTLAEIYIEQNLAAKWDSTQRASAWLTQQLAELKARLERSESDLLTYAMRHSIIFVEEQKNITTEKLRQLEEELTRAEGARIAKQSAYLLTRDALERGGEMPGNLNSDAFRELSLRLAEAHREYAQLLVTFAPGYPQARRVASQIEQLEKALQAEQRRMLTGVRDDYQAGLEREKLLRESVLRQTRSVNVLGDDIIQYNILKRDAESNRQLYDGLQQRLKEAGVSAGLKASNLRVLDPAEVPLKPYTPKKLENAALALAAGLLLGVGLAFLTEHLSTVVRTPEEVERLTGLGLLAVVPRTRTQLTSGDGGRPVVGGRPVAGCAGAGARWEPGPDLTEAYRTLRSSVLLGWDDSMRRLLVTSPQPRDGKTTISLHLAWSLAQLGRRVLLLDADMRKPSCARQLGLDEDRGLGDYLEGRAETEDIVRPTSVENLWLISAGRPQGEASDLLYSPRLAALLRDAGAGWDHVVIDSPPSLALSDARTISRLVEGVVLVVSDETERASLQRTKQAFDDAGVRFLGFVMNRVNLNDLDYGYYRDYGYYYHHREEKTRGQVA
jgi:succinoglycan biosynthesis transport protein ExoP